MSHVCWGTIRAIKLHIFLLFARSLYRLILYQHSYDSTSKQNKMAIRKKPEVYFIMKIAIKTKTTHAVRVVVVLCVFVANHFRLYVWAMPCYAMNHVSVLTHLPLRCHMATNFIHFRAFGKRFKRHHSIVNKYIKRIYLAFMLCVIV